jgi:hypothetical protein
MWKSFNTGDKVCEGATIRYRLGSSHPLSSLEKIFDVIKTEQHYFEIVARSDQESGDEEDRRIIKYMDVGYHINLEIWSGKEPYLSKTKNEQMGNRK